MAAREIAGGFHPSFVQRVAQVLEPVEHVALYCGLERVELSYEGVATLGVLEPSGLWVRRGGEGPVHPGRFARALTRVGDAQDLEGLPQALVAALEQCKRDAAVAVPPILQATQRLYLALMGAQPDALTALAGALEASPQREALWRLWEPRNWRPHMVACAAACITGDGTAADTAWMAFDRFSWACPQLAVALQRIDSGFEGAAATRLERAGAHGDVWPRPLDGYHLDAKSRGALRALLGHAAGEAEQEGARLATRWKQRLEAYGSLSPPGFCD